MAANGRMLPEEHKAVEIRRLMLEARASSELGVNQKYVEFIQAKIISYLMETKTKGQKPESLTLNKSFSTAKVEGEGHEQFKRALEHVKKITFPQNFSYDMKYEVIKIESPAQELIFIRPNQDVTYKLSFIERPGINSTTPTEAPEEGATPQTAPS